MVLPDRDSFGELVFNTDYPAFSSDAVLAQESAPEGRVVIPIDEEKAAYTFYIACKSEDKKKYSAFFNSIRGEVIGNK